MTMSRKYGISKPPYFGVSQPDGIGGRCFNFNGTDQYLSGGTLSTNIIADGKFSISMMYKNEELIPDSDRALWGFYVDADNRLYCYRNNPTDYLYIYGRVNGVIISLVSMYQFTDTDFKNLQFVFDGTNFKLYVDNVMEYENNAIADLSTFVGVPHWYIGDRYSGTYCDSGKYFDTKFFNKALTSDEVSEIYNREYASYVNEITDPSFDTGTDWTLSAPWAIAGGKASFDGVSNNNIANTSCSQTTNKRYKLKFKISNSSGTPSIKIYSGSGAVVNFVIDTASYADGEHIVYFTAPADTTGMQFRAYASGGSFDIEYAYIYEITEDVTFDTSDLYRDCTAWLKMNETSGTTAYDSTSNGNNFTINNGDSAFFSTQSIHKFEYGGNILLNGGMESWVDPTNLTTWSESLGGTSTVNQEAVEVYQGGDSCRIDVDALHSKGQIYQTINLVAGEKRLATTYKNSLANKYARWSLKDNTTNLYLQSDGTWSALPTTIDFVNSLNFKIFEIEFNAQSTGTYLLVVRNGTVSASSSIYFDNIKIQEKV